MDQHGVNIARGHSRPFRKPGAWDSCRVRATRAVWAAGGAMRSRRQMCTARVVRSGPGQSTELRFNLPTDGYRPRRRAAYLHGRSDDPVLFRHRSLGCYWHFLVPSGESTKRQADAAVEQAEAAVSALEIERRRWRNERTPAISGVIEFISPSGHLLRLQLQSQKR